MPPECAFLYHFINLAGLAQFYAGTLVSDVMCGRFYVARMGMLITFAAMLIYRVFHGYIIPE